MLIDCNGSVSESYMKTVGSFGPELTRATVMRSYHMRLVHHSKLKFNFKLDSSGKSNTHNAEHDLSLRTSRTECLASTTIHAPTDVQR
jgi:hypothetical protein